MTGVTLNASYAGTSGVEQGLTSGRVGFATNTLRQQTYFKGELRNPLVFREALGALHSVVVSDFRYKAKDRIAFQTWLAEQDRKFLLSLKAKSADAKLELERVESKLADLDAKREERKKPFYAARTKYFEYVYEHDYELSYL